MNHLFDKKRKSFVSFRDTIAQASEAACKHDLRYCVVKTKEDFDNEMRTTIIEESKARPVIVFLDYANKAHKIQYIAKEIGVPFFKATNDTEILVTLSVIENQSHGIVAVTEAYARGTDIRFSQDSFVLIGFLPERLAVVHQMMGRSSRTMGRHRCKLVCTDKILTSDCVEDRIGALNFVFLKDGIRIAKVMRGRRRSKIKDDSVLEPAFKQGWRTQMSKIKKHIMPKDIAIFERVGNLYKPKTH